MEGDRGLSLIEHPDQWLRCTHLNTAMLDGGGVTLTWSDRTDERAIECLYPAPDPEPPQPAPGTPRRGVTVCETLPARGLAFDRWCRAYATRPERGRVDVTTWPDGGGAHSDCPAGLRGPTGLAVDRRQRLYVAETGGRVVDVVDLVAQRLLRKVPVCGRPVDVVAACGRALVLVAEPRRLVWVDGRRGPLPGPELMKPCGYGRLVPARVTAGPLVLWRRPRGDFAVIARPCGGVVQEVPGAVDLELNGAGMVVVAFAPGQPFRRYRSDGDHWVELEPVSADGWDGGGVTFAPDERIVFTSADGPRWTGPSTGRHATDGSVVTYRLDSGHYRTTWGRIFVDACVPANTSVGVRFVTSDDDDEILDPVAAAGPDRGGRAVPDPGATPPLPSRMCLAAAAGPFPLHRRGTGRDRAWEQIASDDPFDTWEAPVAASPGRCLWVPLVLGGTARVSPRVRAMRIEKPGHHLMKALPQSWSRQDGAAQFMQRFLAPLEGILHELDEKSALRAILLDPCATPQETLAWLATFAGLVLDRRWPDAARRTMVAEAYTLFRIRGTGEMLRRILEIYLGRSPVIVDNWQLRGIGGTVLGLTPEGPPVPYVGGSLRATGTLGRFTIGGTTRDADSFRLSAHRFTVLVPASLTTEQRAVVNQILEVHKPAHTMGGVCELGAGMRVGTQVRVAVTSFVGPPTGFSPAVVGHTNVGDDGTAGTAAVGARLGGTIAGAVRVG
jgi:phage tail-like protein